MIHFIPTEEQLDVVLRAEAAGITTVPTRKMVVLVHEIRRLRALNTDVIAACEEVYNTLNDEYGHAGATHTPVVLDVLVILRAAIAKARDGVQP